ncbi:MAG: tetratricopeptide repeat protein [Phycisphaerales bacterium]
MLKKSNRRNNCFLPDARRASALLLACASGLAMPALAQHKLTPATAAASSATSGSPALVPSTTAPVSTVPAWSIDDYAARSLARLAMMDLRLAGNPTVRDYKLASVLFELAGNIRPDDADLVRRKIESQWNSGDEEAAIAATKVLLKLDPKDTVAQLRLVSSSIDRLQTVESRLAAYERFLGPDGRAIDPAIRSRLALDAALLYRERNNDDKFAEKLKLATALDPTNKEAALVAQTFFAAAVNDPVGRFELLSNLLYSDPLDPGIYMNMTEELASNGAFVGANRLFRIGEKIQTAAGAKIGGEQDLERLILAWQVSGPKTVREDLEKSLNTERHNARQIADRQKIQNVPGEEVVDPMSLRLPRVAEQMRALAAFGEGNTDSLETSLSEFDLTVAKMLNESPDDEKRPKGIGKADAMRIARDAKVDLALVRALTGSQLKQVESGMKDLDPPLPTDDIRTAVIAALMKMHDGKAEEALASLTGLGIDTTSESPDLSDARLYGELAKARVLEALGRKAEAGASYREIIRNEPLTPQGALASTLFDKLAGKREPLFAKTVELEKLAAAVPRWIEDIVDQPRTFVGVSTEPLATTQEPLSPMLVKISIRNLGALPMGLGANKPLNSRFLFSPNLDLRDADARRFSKPEVIDLDRRLRLMPGESIEAVVWADPGFAGWFCEDVASQVVRAKYRVVQGFVTGPRGLIDPGPGCVQSDLPIIVRTTLREATLGAADFAAEAQSAGEGAVVRLGAAARTRVLGESFSSLKVTPVDRQTMAQALAKRYPSLSPNARAALAAIVPTAKQSPEFIDFDTVVLEEKDPAILPIALLTRCSSADAPALKAAMESTDERVKLVAKLQSERLADRSTCYATMGTNIDEAIDPIRPDAPTPPAPTAAPAAKEGGGAKK